MGSTGVAYTGKQTEYQYFPEDYFSGSDVALYFDDVFVDDVMALEFGLQEKVTGIYGYNSYTADAFSRGQRIVQGSFTIAFKEAGYIYRIMEHIGQEKQNAKPLISYYMGEGDDGPPEWLANPNETIEALLNRKAGTIETIETAPNWETMSLSSSSYSVVDYQTWLLDNANNSRYKGIYVTYASNFKGPYSVGGSYEDMKYIKARLNTYLYNTAKFIQKPLDASSKTYDAATVQAIKIFQNKFSTSLAVDGVLGAKTLAVFNLGLTKSGVYDAPTKLATMSFQKANGLAIDGILGPETKAKMQVSVMTPSTNNTNSTNSTNLKVGSGAEADFAQYEASIWGEQSTYDPAFKDNPFFYGSVNQEWLRIDGFDIYINYGPLYRDKGPTGNTVSYNTTVNAIRNVQLTGVQKMISPTGEPIAERYTFIAKDID